MALNLRRRTAGLLVGLTLGAAGLTGCGVGADTVAKVDNETLTVKEFQSAIDDAYADPIVGKQAKEMGSSFRTTFLNQLLSAEIAKAVAKKAGITVTDAKVEAKLKEMLGDMSMEDAQLQYAMSGQPMTPELIRAGMTTALVNDELGQKVTGKTQAELSAEQLATLKAQRDANPTQFTTYDLTFAATTDQARAQSWVDKTKSGTAGTLTEVVAADPDPQLGGEAATQPISGAQEDPEIIKQLAAIPAGDTGILSAPDPSSGQTYYIVATVNAVTPISDEELQAQAEQAAQQEFMTAGATEAAEVAKEVDVEVNPRYGKVEYPQQGLPSITVPTSDTFTEPTGADPAGVPGLPTGG